MSNPLEQLETDFAKRPKWLQDAATRLLSKGGLSAQDIQELAALCKAECGIGIGAGEMLVFQSIPAGALAIAEEAHSLRLVSIADVKGVNALAPKKALEFGTAPIAILYGRNGSGKSGYARMLKHACAAKNPPPLHGNVFDAGVTDPTCSIRYVLDGAEKTASWTSKSGPVSDLRAIPIYDAATAEIYVNEENEATFEPSILRLFRQLAEASAAVETALQTEIDSKVSALPKLPPEYKSTPSGAWYGALTHATTPVAIDTHCCWTPEDEQNLYALRQRPDEKSPTEKAKALRRTKTRADELRLKIEAMHARVSDDSFCALQNARLDARKKRETATTDAKKVFENCLDGVGSESWKALWSAAREYSQEHPYKGTAFPNTSAETKCVLCHQPLDDAAKTRLEGFEAFVKGRIEAEAAAAEKIVQDILTALDDTVAPEAIPAALDAAGIEDASTRESIAWLVQKIANRSAKFTIAESEADLPEQPVNDVSSKLSDIAAGLEKQASAFEEDAKGDKKTDLTSSLTEANAKKWVSQQRTAIQAEVARLSAVYALNGAIAKTNTRWLSDTKAALSEKIVTAGFMSRFEAELKLLRAGRIQVEIRKTAPRKGQVFHQLLIKGAKRPAKPCDVLSEGQFRIVSIAAFLADISSKSGAIPLVFDDPVCSLDEDYEIAIAQRLVALSKDRQVIVFTHRLSMLSLLEDTADKAGVDTTAIAVRHETWGAGEPGATTPWAQRPDRALKSLRDEHMKRARATLASQGHAEYENAAKIVSSNFRILIERVVETHLLNEVVQRFRRGIQTMGRIESLAKITPEDCTMIDDLMTKYSFFEHSQPDESPCTVPEPDEIEADLNKVILWCEEFKKRPAPSSA